MSPFATVIDAFNSERVSYVVVGGLATVLHGHARVTADIDYVIDLTESNASRAIEILTRLGFVPRLPVDPKDFANSKVRDQWISEKGMTVFSFYKKDDPVVGVDLFCRYPVAYDELVERSVEKPLDNLKVRICGVDDLIDMKTAANRARDVEDVRVLRRIHGRSK